MLGETEVAQIGALTRVSRQDEHIAGLDVTVDEAERVRRVESAGNLPDQLDRPLGHQRTLALENGSQVQPVDEAHREVERPAVGADGESRDDMRLVEPGGDLRFAEESLAEARILREFGDQYFERDLPPLGILREVDGACRTASEQARDPISGDNAPGLEDVRHVRCGA